MPLPLPRVVPDIPEEGFILNSMKAKNALAKQNLENWYYGPEKESEIGYRSSLRQGQDITNKFAPQNFQSEIDQRNALTRKYNTLTPLEAKELELKNQSYPDFIKSQIQLNNLGGRYGYGAGGKEEFMFQNFVAKDNPQLDNNPEKVYEAANVLRQGGDTLADGTKLNALSPAARSSLDRIYKYGSTAAVVTAGVRANQSEKEIEVMNNYAQKGLENYGNTDLFNMSPEQILDSFKTDKESQTKLGKFIASQALQYEIAQLRIRLAGGQPGIRATEDLMRTSQQTINTAFPRLSYTARKEASDYLDTALSDALEARKSVGIGASTTVSNKKKNENNDPLGIR